MKLEYNRIFANDLEFHIFVFKHLHLLLYYHTYIKNEKVNTEIQTLNTSLFELNNINIHNRNDIHLDLTYIQIS